MHIFRHGARLLFDTLCAATLCQPDDLPPEVLLIARTIQANRKLFSHLPQFTCLEIISRGKPRNPSRKMQLHDVVQLDVALGDKEELYSWPGDPTFLPPIWPHSLLMDFSRMASSKTLPYLVY